ncbi:MAG: hypothetical protein GF330_12690 [Candidatus Eisenbacteria bacterium]|nr:hypothetical protein [Candidatus Eisenbacteria bacterium]
MSDGPIRPPFAKTARPGWIRRRSRTPRAGAMLRACGVAFAGAVLRACGVAFAGAVLLACAALLSPAPRAERATSTEMHRVCENFLRYTLDRQGHWAGSRAPRIVGGDAIVVGPHGATAQLPAGTLLARNYEIFPSGHIVVPALKELPPIKAYSEPFALEVAAAGGFSAMLRQILTDRALRFIHAYGSLDAAQPTLAEGGGDPAAAGLLFGPTHRRLWDLLLRDPPRFHASLARNEFGRREEVGPLLTTSWHQAAPYWDYCPMGDGGRCVVGCVATATAQVMRHWAWPPRGNGESWHYWNGDQSCGGDTPGENLFADYSDPYDWENMPDNCLGGCVAEERAALAELNFEVGVGELIDYGHCGSGGVMEMVILALRDYFHYEPQMELVSRGEYTADTWFELIRDEIDAGRPMPYGIPGHALVCDGWRTDAYTREIHMNYGWGGSYNAWYVLDELYGLQNPLNQSLIAGVRPVEIFPLQPDGSGLFPTIQDAVDMARDGTRIVLADGTYTGPGNRDIDLLGKQLTIRSQSGDYRTCTIDCQGSAQDPHRAFVARSAETAATVIEGLTIRGGYAGEPDPSGGAIVCMGAAPTLRECLLMENRAAERGGAVYCGEGATPVLERCIYLGNQALTEGGALACDGAVPQIENCCFLEGTAADGSAIAAIGASALLIDSTILAFGEAGEPVACIAGGSAQLACCDVYGNAAGDYVGCLEGQYGVDGNISADPIFCNPDALDFTLAAESPCLPHTPPNEPCELIGAYGAGCGAIVVYQDGSGPFPTIQSAIDAAAEGATIHLAEGVFTGEGNRDIDFGGRSVTVRSLSGDPATCAIDCQGSAETWHRGFVFDSDEGPASVLEGVTVRGGHYDIAGAVCIESCSPTLRNVVLADNSADFGGAVRARNGATPLFERVVFLRNSARLGAGAYCLGGSDATFRNCTFHDNAASHYGAGLRVHDHTNAILENTIIAFSSRGEAVSCHLASYPVLSCCDLYGNAGGDWTGPIAEQLGVSGNISEDPLFCDAAAGDVGLQPGSPCAPYAPPNGACGLLGARYVGCGVSDAQNRNEQGGDGETSLVNRLWLRPASPSPMLRQTRIEFGIPATLDEARVHLAVIDPAGRRVRCLLDEVRGAGRHVTHWNGTDGSGRAAPGGLYFLRLTVGEREIVRRIVRAR